MPFAKCYYHIVWATKYRAAIIDSKLQSLIKEIIQQKSRELHSPILAIDAMPDHIHVAVQISTQLSVAEWARRVKGVSSHEVNAAFPDLETTFAWQKSYGVVTFGEKQAGFVVNYITNQREHHANNHLYALLENTDDG
ncbi:MAG: IS200/IS605 family transposase [Anaerolineae bacterium]|nr:IS200/IS605 family transposase [Anaerolineae bacterium]